MKHQLVITATGEVKLPQPSTTGHCHYPCCCCSHYCYYYSSTSYSAIPQVRTALVWGRMKCMKCIGHHLAPIMGFHCFPPLSPLVTLLPSYPRKHSPQNPTPTTTTTTWYTPTRTQLVACIRFCRSPSPRDRHSKCARSLHFFASRFLG